MFVSLWALLIFIVGEKKSGGYDKEEKAARAYDLAALKYWGTTTTTNFPVCLLHHFDFVFCLFWSGTKLPYDD